MDYFSFELSTIHWSTIFWAVLISIGAFLLWYLAWQGFKFFDRWWLARVTPRLLALQPHTALSRLFRWGTESANTTNTPMVSNAWPMHFAQIIARALRLVFWGASLLWGFIALTFVLALFPATQDFSQSLLAMVWRALSQAFLLIANAIPGLLVTLVVLFVARLAIRFSNRFFTNVMQETIQTRLLHRETAAATRRIVNLFIVLLAIALVYPFLPGSSSEAFKGMSFLVGLMITLGSTGVLSQMMSGLVLIYARSLRVGDYISVNQNEGVVQDIGLLAVKITNIRNEEITIPHAVLVAHPIHNFSRQAQQHGSMLSTKLSIGYDTDWRVVHQLVLAAADKSPLRKAPKPFVLQRALADFYVEYELVFSIDNPIERLQVLSVLHAHILDGFNQAGVQIMSPHFMVQPKDAVLARAQ